MILDYPVTDRHVPAGGHFGSDWMMSGGKRVPRANRHTGIDWSDNAGDEVRAIGAATVVYVGTSASWGNYVWLHHGKDPFSGKQVWSAYAHLAATARVKVGANIKRGTLLGYVGSSGNVSGPHLHHVIALCATLAQAMSLAWSVLTDPVKFIAARLSPKVAANQRQVKATGTARRRKSASTNAVYDAAKNFAAGAIVTPQGFVRSIEVGGTYGGSNVWYVVGGLYSHVSGFTSASTANLVDLTPPVVVPEPNPPAPQEPDPLPEEPEPAPEPEPDPSPEPPDPTTVVLPTRNRIVGILIAVATVIASVIGWLVTPK
jgi:hypothetical protein